MEYVTSDRGFYSEVPGRCIVKSGGTGKWTPYDVEELMEHLLAIAGRYEGKKWAYIADPSRMDPIISKETSEAFIRFHEKLGEVGCQAIAFLDANTSAMKLLSQRHQNISGTNMEVIHLRNEAEALEWLAEMDI